jgi:hypothetical protein
MQDLDKWYAEVQRNSDLIDAALDAVRAEIPADSDAGAALALAVCHVLHPNAVEPFIAVLRMFARPRSPTSSLN